MRAHRHAGPVTKALKSAQRDGRVTAGEARAIVKAARAGGVTQGEKRFLSKAVAANVDSFDTGAQAKLYKLGARWTQADAADPNPMSGQAKNYRVSFGKLFVGGISPTDLRQGNTGDCYLLSAMSSVAKVRPDLIKQAFTANKDGSVSVRLFRQNEAGQIEPVIIRVDRDTVKAAGNSVYAQGTDRRELWPVLLEKAYAQLNGGFEPIGHGRMLTEGLLALTGQPAEHHTTQGSTPEAVLALLQQAMNERRPITAATSPTETAPGLVAGHAYSVLGLVDRGAGPMVQLRNPWGQTEPGAAPGAGDGAFELSLADFQRAFPWVAC